MSNKNESTAIAGGESNSVKFTAQNYYDHILKLTYGHGQKYTDVAYFISNLAINITEKLKAAAAVAVVNRDVQLWFNPTLMAKYTKEEQGAIIIHELSHLMLNHLSVFKDLFGDKTLQQLMNIAADLEINQSPFEVSDYKLPSDSCFYDKHPFDTMGLASGQTAWYYFKKINTPKNKQKLQKAGVFDQFGDILVFDENEEPVDISTLSQQEIDTINDAIKGKIEDLMKGAPPGTRTSIFKKEVWWKLKPPVVPWQRYLRQFSSSSVNELHRLVKNRFSRRGDDAMFGKRQNFSCRLLICIDESGSVSDEWLTEGLNEIHAIWKMHREDVHFDILHIDTEIIGDIKPYDGKYQRIGRRGCGGTDMSPAVFEFVYSKNQYDGMILFTDGEFYTSDDVYSHPKMAKSLWVHYPGYAINKGLPGKKIRMDNNYNYESINL